MLQCAKCRISIRGTKTRCPLCGGRLTGEPEADVFPVLRKKKMSRLSLLKIATFGVIAFEVAMLVLCYSLHRIPTGLALAMLAALIGLADVALTLYYRNNLLRLLSWEIYIAMGLTLLVDVFTGFHRWSVSWVTPVLFAVLMITMSAVSAGTRKSFEESIRYLLFHTFLSTVLQMVFLLLRWNPLPLPAIISMVFVLLYFFGVAFFHARAFRREMQKTFNL